MDESWKCLSIANGFRIHHTHIEVILSVNIKYPTEKKLKITLSRKVATFDQVILLKEVTHNDQ